MKAVFCRFFSKMTGGKHCPPRAPLSEILWSGIGGFLGIAAIYILGVYLKLGQQPSIFLIGSFGASAVLLYGTPLSPYAQPKNLVGGHAISAIAGVTAYLMLPDNMLLAAALGVAVAIMLMHLTHTIHPPGGASALIAVIGGQKIHALGYWYVITPVVFGAVVMLLVALVVNNLSPGRRYPQWWF